MTQACILNCKPLCYHSIRIIAADGIFCRAPKKRSTSQAFELAGWLIPSPAHIKMQTILHQSALSSQSYRHKSVRENVTIPENWLLLRPIQKQPLYSHGCYSQPRSPDPRANWVNFLPNAVFDTLASEVPPSSHCGIISPAKII